MAKKGLPAKYLKAAWKTKGATQKNALKRAWAAYRKSKGKSKSKSSTKKSKSKSKGGNKTGNKNGFSIPSLPTIAKTGVAISWLAFRQTGYGVPAAEIQNKNFMGALRGILQNAADVIMTMDGWTKVIGPIALISLVQKMVPRTQVNIMGVRWRIM